MKSKKIYNKSIRNTIFIYFTITSLIAVLLIVISIYSRISAQISDATKIENLNRINRIDWSMEVYLRNIIKLSDTIYYRVIKNADLSKEYVNDKLSLLYNNNQGQIKNIVILSKDGKVLSAFPAVRLQKITNIEKEPWFGKTLNKPENIYFTTPHVQSMFKSEESGNWVISMSRAVEVTIGDSTEQAVLLIELTYSGINEVLKGPFTDTNYVYLISSNGDIIWHPKFNLISAGLINEDNLIIAKYGDGSYDELNGKMTTLKTVGYTGWKLVGVMKGSGISLNLIKTRLFIVFIIFLIVFIVAMINYYISFRITDPIRELEKSVKELEEGNLSTDIYMGGSYEIQHLSNSIQDMRNKIKKLMKDIVREHEEKRKSELNSLQAQINPHFLYNTLDIIVWQIENGKQSEAVHIVTALARFFRLSLGKGKNIVTVEAEIEHVKNYLAIQYTRFKNKFNYEFDVDDDVLDLSSLKLSLQPLVENAVYHGCEFMDGDGLITVKAWKDKNDLYISVTDNGLGMTQEKIDMVLSGKAVSNKSNGSGIGVKNVNERIKLYFGEEYGIKIESEPDEGTVITIHLPVIPYTGGEKL